LELLLEIERAYKIKNILVSGASGIVGYGILRSLRMSNIPLKLIGTSIYEDSVAQGFCDIFEGAPHTDSPKYMEWLQSTINTYSIDLIIPGIEVDMYKWIQHIPEIEKIGARALLNNKELIHLCKDKWMFYNYLMKISASCVIESSLSSDYENLKNIYGIPFLLKPRCGFGSKGIVHVHDKDTFMKYKDDIGHNLMAQPIIGNDDEEYTATAFCDGNGGYYASMVLKRKLSKEGFTEKAEVVSEEKFAEIISYLSKNIHSIGPTNFQFRKCEEGFKLLEINPRISSSTSIRAAFGYNESAMAVSYYLENKIPVQPTIRMGRAVRYIDDHIFYENSINI
jgi:carbamoyl-phosphate synthase large subunit